MESPFSWRKAEHVVYEAERLWYRAQAAGIIGASRVIAITNALREAGLLVEVGEDAESLNVLPGRHEAKSAVSAPPPNFAFPASSEDDADDDFHIVDYIGLLDGRD